VVLINVLLKCRYSLISDQNKETYFVDDHRGFCFFLKVNSIIFQHNFVKLHLFHRNNCENTNAILRGRTKIVRKGENNYILNIVEFTNWNVVWLILDLNIYLSRGGSRDPPKIGKNMIFWRKIVIFHTKYPQHFHTSLRSAPFF
jgi:hypothetical protein